MIKKVALELLLFTGQACLSAMNQANGPMDIKTLINLVDIQPPLEEAHLAEAHLNEQPRIFNAPQVRIPLNQAIKSEDLEFLKMFIELHTEELSSEEAYLLFMRAVSFDKPNAGRVIYRGLKKKVDTEIQNRRRETIAQEEALIQKGRLSIFIPPSREEPNSHRMNLVKIINHLIKKGNIDSLKRFLSLECANDVLIRRAGYFLLNALQYHNCKHRNVFELIMKTFQGKIHNARYAYYMAKYRLKNETAANAIKETFLEQFAGFHPKTQYQPPIIIVQIPDTNKLFNATKDIEDAIELDDLQLATFTLQILPKNIAPQVAKTFFLRAIDYDRPEIAAQVYLHLAKQIDLAMHQDDLTLLTLEDLGAVPLRSLHQCIIAGDATTLRKELQYLQDLILPERAGRLFCEAARSYNEEVFNLIVETLHNKIHNARYVYFIVKHEGEDLATANLIKERFAEQFEEYH